MGNTHHHKRLPGAACIGYAREEKNITLGVVGDNTGVHVALSDTTGKCITLGVTLTPDEAIAFAQALLSTTQTS